MLNTPQQSLSEGSETGPHSQVGTLEEGSGQDGQYVRTLPVLQAPKSITAAFRSQGCSEHLGL